MPLDDSVVAAVTNANFKNIAEMGSITAGVASQNLVAHNRAMDGLREAFVAESTLQRAGFDVGEGAGTGAIQGLTNTLATAIAQILTKAGQTTPPSTTG